MAAPPQAMREAYVAPPPANHHSPPDANHAPRRPTKNHPRSWPTRQLCGRQVLTCCRFRA